MIQKKKHSLIKTINILGREISRQNRIALISLAFGSLVLLLIMFIGAPLYYHRYSRNDSKASISKNPNYGKITSNSIVMHASQYFFCEELYTPDQWEIDKDSVTLEKLIGQGHFGQVYKGVLKLSDGTLKNCAVKVICHKFYVLPKTYGNIP